MIANRLWLVFLGVSACVVVEGVEDTPFVTSQLPQTEWEAYFTGPLLAPVGTVMPVGNYDVEPYFFYIVNNGTYDNHWRAHKTPNIYSVIPALFLNVGLLKRVDCGAILPVSYNYSQGRRDVGMGDINAFVGFQILEEGDSVWAPWVKLALVGVFPAGRYQRFNPQKPLISSHGNGTWGTGLDLVFYKLLHIKDEKFLSMNLSFTYTWYTKFSVEGFNTYGGGFGTHGRIDPGNTFVGSFSFEYSFNRYWAFAMDTIYYHFDADLFNGCPGWVMPGIPASVGDPSSEQITLSPALEYNFNQNFGIIGGCWFTVTGRNANRFRSGVIAFNMLF